jgi:hypothetical protein
LLPFLYFAKATLSNFLTMLLQFYMKEDGLDYEDAIAVQASIGDTWWLTSLSCKYMLCCFVHKDCKDLSTRPTELPSGHTRKEARVNSHAVLAKEREESKVERIVGGER